MREDFALGASFTVPYGSGIAWPEDWTRRFDWYRPTSKFCVPAYLWEDATE